MVQNVGLKVTNWEYSSAVRAGHSYALVAGSNPATPIYRQFSGLIRRIRSNGGYRFTAISAVAGIRSIINRYEK